MLHNSQVVYSYGNPNPLTAKVAKIIRKGRKVLLAVGLKPDSLPGSNPLAKANGK